MLVDLPTTPHLPAGQVGLVIALMGGGRVTRLDTGMYEVGGYNFRHHIPAHLLVNEYPFTPPYSAFRDLPDDERLAAIQAAYARLDEINAPGDYGVCDYPAQLIEKHPVIVTDERPLVVGFTKVVKADEPWDGGWRWHKWGEYIGDKTPECEYIADEGPDITEVYCYSICEVKAS